MATMNDKSESNHLRFKRWADAANAGFVRASSFRLPDYRNFGIRCRDVSGQNSYGYRYQLELSCNWCWLEGGGLRFYAEESFPTKLGADINGIIALGGSVTLSLSEELNKIGTPGCFSVCFSPEVIEQAKHELRERVDAFYAAVPEAGAFIERMEAGLASEQTKQALQNQERLQARARRLAKKYGAENLSPIWKKILAAAEDDSASNHR